MQNVRAVQQESNKGFDWRDRASCLVEDPELFFPVGTMGPALLQIEDAKKVCEGCVVRNVCLQWALDNNEAFGVWGGMSEDERRALKRRRVGKLGLQNQLHNKIA